jgi:hypothetical protein
MSCTRLERDVLTIDESVENKLAVFLNQIVDVSENSTVMIDLLAFAYICSH